MSQRLFPCTVLPDTKFKAQLRVVGLALAIAAAANYFMLWLTRASD